jgi:hypothetical protein
MLCWTIWTHIQTWSRNHQNNLLDKYSRIFGSKLQPLECQQDFSIFSSCDLVIDQIWPIFTNDLENIKITFLFNFKDIWFKTAATRVLTRFSIVCFCDLVFDQRWPILKFDLQIMQTIFLTNFQNIWIKTSADKSVNKLFLFLAPVT